MITADVDFGPPRQREHKEEKEGKEEKKQTLITGFTSQSPQSKRAVEFAKILAGNPILREKDTSVADSYFVNKRKAGNCSPQAFMLSFAKRMMPGGLRVKWHTMQLVGGRKPLNYHNYGVIFPSDLFSLIYNSHTRKCRAVKLNNLSFYELIEESTPCCLYFDIEIKGYPLQPTSGDHTIVINTIHYAVNAQLERMNIFLGNVAAGFTHRAVSCADRESDDGSWMLSLHLHYPKLVFPDNHTTMLAFTKSMARFMGTAPQWDQKVYTKNRLLRMVYNTKNRRTDSVLYPLRLMPTSLMWVPLEEDVPRVEVFNAFILRRNAASINVPATAFDALLVPSVVARVPARVPLRAQQQQHQNAVLTKLEMRFVRNMFYEFLLLRRKTYGGIEATTTAGCDMRQDPLKPTTFYMNIPGDMICEHKGRAHTSNNPSTTGYCLSFTEQTIHQTCFACKEPRNLFSFAPCAVPGLHPVSMPVHLWWSMYGGEYSIRDLFIREHAFMLHSVPSPTFTKETDTMWVFNDADKLWSRDISAKLSDWVQRWMRQKVDLVMEYDPPKDEKVLKLWKKEMNRYRSSPACRSLRNTIPSAVINVNFDNELHVHHDLVPTNDNKVVDARTLESRTRTISDMFTTAMDFKMIPLDHPDIVEVNEFMLEYCNGEESIKEYLQELLGYVHTGWTWDRSFYLWLGAGANAKGTIAAAIQQTMGPFFLQSAKAFMSKRGSANQNSESASPNLAGARFKRCVMLSETPKDHELDVAHLKGLVSGDPQTARELYKTATTYTPTFKVVIQTNFLPVNLDVSDAALLDRLKLLKFLVRYTSNPSVGERQKDPVKRDRFLSLKDAFGTWCLQGASRAYSKSTTSLVIPARVKELQDTELAKLDLVALFISRRASFGDTTYSWGHDAMFESFRNWCSRRNSNYVGDITLFVGDVMLKVGGNGVQAHKGVFICMRENTSAFVHDIAEIPGMMELPAIEDSDFDFHAGASFDIIPGLEVCKSCRLSSPTVCFGYCDECRAGMEGL